MLAIKLAPVEPEKYLNIAITNLKNDNTKIDKEIFLLYNT